MLKLGVLSIACAIALTAVRAQEAPVSDTVKLQRMAARFAPTEIGADLSKAVGRRSPRPRQARRGVEDHRRAVPAAGLGRQRGDAARSRHGRDAGGSRAAALLPDQQGTVVAARSQRAVRPGRAGQARGRELLSGRRVEGGHRTLDAVAARGRARARHRLLHRHSPRPGGGFQHRALQRRVSERAGAAPRRCCAKRRR